MSVTSIISLIIAIALCIFLYNFSKENDVKSIFVLLLIIELITSALKIRWVSNPFLVKHIIVYVITSVITSILLAFLVKFTSSKTSNFFTFACLNTVIIVIITFVLGFILSLFGLNLN